MGCIYAFPRARDGSRDGFEKFKSGLVRIPWRCDRLCHRHVDDLVHERDRLSHRRRGQADVQPVLSLSTVLRVNDLIRRVWFVVWNVLLKPASSTASSVTEEQTVFVGYARPLLHRD